MSRESGSSSSCPIRDPLSEIRRRNQENPWSPFHLPDCRRTEIILGKSGTKIKVEKVSRKLTHKCGNILHTEG